MGPTSADTQREIESLRDDLSGSIQELERRARHAVDFKAQAREHPTALGVLGLSLLAGVSIFAYRAVSAYRESRKSVNRLKRRAGEVRGELGERWEQTREQLPTGVTLRNRHGEPTDVAADPGMIKNLLWMGLTAGTVAVAGLLARRVSITIWQLIMHEPPPTSKI